MISYFQGSYRFLAIDEKFTNEIRSENTRNIENWQTVLIISFLPVFKKISFPSLFNIPWNIKWPKVNSKRSTDSIDAPFFLNADKIRRKYSIRVSNPLENRTVICWHAGNASEIVYWIGHRTNRRYGFRAPNLEGG